MRICPQHIFKSELNQHMFLNQHNWKDIPKAVLVCCFLLDILYTPNSPYMSVLLSDPLHWISGKVHTIGDFLSIATHGEKELTSINVNKNEFDNV